jgi:hypothetical protein
MSWLYLEVAWLGMALCARFHGLAWLCMQGALLGMAFFGGCMALSGGCMA